MKPGDRVTFNGRTGTVKALQPGSMVDVCFDDASHRIERRASDRLTPAGVIARPNGGRRPRPARAPRGAHRNPDLIAEQLVGVVRDKKGKWSDLYEPMLDWAFYRTLSETSRPTELAQLRAMRQQESSFARMLENDWALYDAQYRRSGYAGWKEAFVEEQIRSVQAQGAEKKQVLSKRGRFEGFMGDGAEVVTSVGRDRLEEELRRRKTVDRPRIVRDIDEARKHGDLSENAEYQYAKEEQSKNEGRILELEGIISRLRVVLVPETRFVAVGTSFTVTDLETNDKANFRLVGESESDPGKGDISYKSSLGAALNLKTVGEVSEAVLPDGRRRRLVIESIEGSTEKGQAVALPEEEESKARQDVLVAMRERSAREREMNRVREQVVQKAERAVDLTDIIKSKGAGYFTRPDPPRVSSDGKAFCGNPIDGTAYYLIVSDANAKQSYWLTLDEVERAFQSSSYFKQKGGKPIQFAAGPHHSEVLKNSTVFESVLLRALPLVGKVTPSLQDLLLRRATVLIDGQPDPDILRAFVANPDAKLLIEVPIRGTKTIDIYFPSKERLQAQFAFFREKFYPEIEEERFDMQIVPTSVSPRKFVRGRAGMGLSPELARRERSARPSGKEPDFGSFSIYDPEKEEQVFFTIYKSFSAQRRKLQRFQAYDFRKFRYNKEEGAEIADAVHQASLRSRELAPLGVHPEVARMFIQSGGLTVNGQFVTDPDDMVSGNATLIMSLGEKSRSPFFSWVRDASPILLADARRAEKGELRGEWADCLTPEKKDEFFQLRRLKNALWSYKKAFGDIRFLFKKVSGSGEALRTGGVGQKGSLRRWERQPVRDVDAAIIKLAGSYAYLARVIREIKQSAKTNEPWAERLYAMLENSQGSALEPLDGNPRYIPSPLQRALTMYRREEMAAQGLAGLIFGDEDDLASKMNSADVKLFKATLAQRVLEVGPLVARAFRENYTGYIPKPGRRAYRWLKEMAYRMELKRAAEALLKKSLPDMKTMLSALFEAATGTPAKRVTNNVILATLIKWGQTHAAAAEGQDPEVTKLAQLLSGKNVTMLRDNLTEDVAFTHPFDDLYVYASPGLRAETTAEILKTREQALRPTAVLKGGQFNGSTLLRLLDKSKNAASEEEVINRIPEVERAVTYATDVGELATGGRLRQGQRVDPITGDPFELLAPPNWPTSGEEQEDANWAIRTVIRDVFPALVYGRERSLEGGKRSMTSDEAATEAADLLLLARMYDDLGGYLLAGPLNPEQTSKATPLIDVLLEDINTAQIQLQGGTAGISALGGYTVFKTYNPVLFELTRLFWPTSESGDPRWSSILAHPDLLQHVDAVGRFGHAAEMIQTAALGSRSPEDLRYQLERKVQPIGRLTLEQLMRNWLDLEVIEGVRYTKEQLRAPTGLYAPFLLMWPLGFRFTPDTYQHYLQWSQDPLGFLLASRQDVTQAVNAVMRLRGRGLEQSSLPQLSPTIGKVWRGEMTIDPSSTPATDEEKRARKYLGQALVDALSGKRRSVETFESLPEAKRAAAEKQALMKFQATPGAIREKREGPARLIELAYTDESGSRLPPSGQYDKATLRLLEQRRRAGSQVVGDIPFVFSGMKEMRTSQGTMAKGAEPIFSGDPRFGLPGSVLAQAEKESSIEFMEDMKLVERQLKGLEAAIAAKKKKE